MKKKKPTISIIVAMDEKRGIGKNNGLLWHIPEDLKHFKKLTRGHPIIMGRKTYESIGKALPGRTNIVISSNQDFSAPGCIIVTSLQHALQTAKHHEKDEIFIIGGGSVYEQALPLADKLYLTLVKGNFNAENFFPDYSEFSKVLRKNHLVIRGITITFFELTRGT